MDGETNTLASRGLEEPFFQLCCVRFWFWREICFGLHTHILRVQYSCGGVLVFLVLAGNSFLSYVHTYLVYNSVVLLCPFFGCSGK